jgi:hypothetical protein
MVSAIEALSVKWERIASSDAIVQGQLNLPKDVIASLNSSAEPIDILLPFEVTSSAKGKIAKQKILIHYFAKSSSRTPSTKLIVENNRKHLIAFLYNSDRASEFYFAERHTPVILPFKSSDWLETTGEVEKQRNVIASFSKSAAARPNPNDLVITQLLNDLTKPAKQQQAWNRLINLNRVQLIALVKFMDDTRSLNHMQISIDTPLSDMESIAHYSPPTVLDALSLLLNHKSGANLRCLFSGGSADERKATLESWKIWAVYSKKT